VVFVGPSGCGKSTLLRVIAGLEEITSGDLNFDGEKVNALTPSQRGIAMVFQSYALYPNMTVRQNISFGLEIQKMPKVEQVAIVDKVSKMLQIEPLLDRKPKQLSGGQRQRVAMGRALARDPSIYLFDEPLSNLDAKLRVEMRSEIKELHQRMGTTIVYVTHDQIEAMTLGDVIAVMKDGEIQQFGTPQDIYDNPSSQFIAGFMGSPSMNFVPCQLEQSVQGLMLTLESGGVTHQLHVDKSLANLNDWTGKQVILGIRPEQVTQVSEDKPDTMTIPCAVEIVEPTGPDTLVTIRLNGVKTVCRVHPTAKSVAGEMMPLQFDMSKAVFFDPETEQRIY
jgi:multiple sugar transport system ATP-binding protein